MVESLGSNESPVNSSEVNPPVARKLIEEHISDLKYRVHTLEETRADDVSVVVLTFIGFYRRGSAGCGDGRFMQYITECAMSMYYPDAVLFDFRELDYQYGNNIWDVFPDDVPYNVVETEDYMRDIARPNPCCFDDFGAALKNTIEKAKIYNASLS